MAAGMPGRASGHRVRPVEGEGPVDDLRHRSADGGGDSDAHGRGGSLYVIAFRSCSLGVETFLRGTDRPESRIVTLSPDTPQMSLRLSTLSHNLCSLLRRHERRECPGSRRPSSPRPSWRARRRRAMPKSSSRPAQSASKNRFPASGPGQRCPWRVPPRARRGSGRRAEQHLHVRAGPRRTARAVSSSDSPSNSSVTRN